MSTPLVLGGKRVGRFRASFLLFKETFRFFWTDKEMLGVPIVALIMQLFFLGVLAICILASGLFVDVGSENVPLAPKEYVAIFAMYVISAFTIAYSQAAITHIVYTRVHGGDATLWGGLRTAGKHTGSLLVWACIASTVGLLIRIIAERSQLLVKICVALLGAMWSVLTYFVVPAIIIDQKSPFAAIGHSGTIFKRTWGETLVSNISFGFVFLAFYVVLFVSLIGALYATGGSEGTFIVCAVILVGVILVTCLLSAVLNSVLRTLLYVYASEQIIPTNFNRELLESMLARKQGPGMTTDQHIV